MNYKESIEHIVDLENQVLINTDDSIIKACEENAEFGEAVLSGETMHIIDEAADAVVNTLCATLRVCDTIPSEYSFFGQGDIVKNTINHGKRIGAIQTARRRYTRQEKSITTKQVLDCTQKYVEGIIGQAKEFDDSITLQSLITHSIGKIEGRMEQYLPQIDLKEYIKDDLDFKPGIVFKDIAPLLANSKALQYIAKILAYKARNADVIAGLDARGFIFGSIVAYILGKPFIMIRKKGKMPGNTYEVDYGKEYGEDVLTLQKDADIAGKKVAIVDDLLATGGSAGAGVSLVKMAQGEIEGNYFAIGLDALHGDKKLEGKVESVLHY